ncbi:hypothetical protein [Rhizobium sp. CSW-27]|uniref:hypothetical protein n=1 Tax=Rhizobium sp. CSW-27 TaxID=2839985 RepID=UPI001C013883|nr:hypothetical protein [Rhizobium sp. CSW-27]MBT9371467.1 hypothetical protein [Rhizobium sp. CSW-27]
MSSALIGHTGFVGGAISRQHAFDHLFNSKNIASAREQDFSLVACAAAPGSMFEANRFPDRDAARVDALIDILSTISADRFILLSSIAVLASFDKGLDEETDDYQLDLAYGRNRRRLEAFCAEHFNNCLIVRLPALFGEGLKKNFIFDILNPMPSMLPPARFGELCAALPETLAVAVRRIYSEDTELGMMMVDRAGLDASGLRSELEAAVTELGYSALAFTNPDSEFQYYDMSQIWSDVSRSVDAGLPTIHLAPAPLKASAVFELATGETMAPNGARLHREDMRTCHASLWQRDGVYMQSPEEVADRLKAYFAQVTP